MNLYNLASEISKAFDYIENNLTDKIALEDIANVSGLSKYHLHRILSEIANRPLMDYVRARKLSKSIEKLLSKNYRIIDVAFEYSFEYEQSYIRAFKKEFGISPGALRTQPIPVKTTERILPIHYTSVSNGVLIHPVFIYKPQINVIGKKTYIDVRRNRWDLTENEKRKELLFNNINEVYQCLKQEVFIGLTRWDANKAASKYYLSASEAVSSEEIPKGYRVDTIPSSNYAVFKYIGLFHIKHLNQSQLEELWEFILFVWMSKTNFHIADDYYFEIIDMSEVKDDYFEINLYIPVS